MKFSEFIDGVLIANEKFINEALEGLTPEELRVKPGPDSNPIGWLVWHFSRTQDNHVSGMTGWPHIYLTEKWYLKFDREGEESDRGRGHTTEQVDALRAPNVETLLGYYNAVRAKTTRFLSELTIDDLDRQVPEVRGNGMVPLATRLTAILVDNIQHTGQVAYLRGLIKGKGWLEA